MAAVQLLIGVLLIGLAAGSVAALVRAAPDVVLPPDLKAVKPFSCPVCMGWWLTILFEFIVRVSHVIDGRSWFAGGYTIEALMQFLAAAGVAAWLNGQLVSAPLNLPSLPGEDVEHG